MLGKGSWIFASLLAAALPAASAAAAESPQKLFEELFGAEAKKVAATPAKADDADFAAKLLKSSETLTEAPALRAILYEKAFEFAIRSSKGYSTAQTALNLLDTAVPEKKQQWDTGRLELYKLQYRISKGSGKKPAAENYITQCLVVGDNEANAGRWPDAVALYQQALNTATHVRSLQKAEATERLTTASQMMEMEELKQRLKKEPDNATVRTALIRFYVEMDQPGWAEPYLKDPNVGEAWRTYVPLATRDISGLPVQVCLELGNWYKTLAFTAKPRAKATLAKRAKAYFLTYLSKARAGGVTAKALAEARGKINAALLQMGQKKLPEEVDSGNAAIQQAMGKAVAYLWSRQNSDGYWTSDSGDTVVTRRRRYYDTCPTSAALGALLAAGATPADKRATKALNFLGMTNTSDTNGVAMRALVWYHAQRRRPGIFFRGLKKDIEALLIATSNGGYASSVTSRYAYSYNIYNWTPPIAVDAGTQMRIRIPKKYWQLVLAFWAKQQKANGGWACRPASTMSYGTPDCLWTTIGCATVATCLRNLYGTEALKRMSTPPFAPLKNGLAYLDKNLRNVAALKGRSSRFSSSYYDRYGTLSDGLWCLSRLGLMTGRGKVGNVDWGRAGPDYLAASQKPNGSWGSDIETARAVLFLLNCNRARSAGLTGTGTAAVGAPTPIAVDDPTRKTVMRKVGLLKQRLAKEPTSKTIPKEIVRLYVVELQDPDSAAPYAARTQDKETQDLVRLAPKAVTDLTDAQCLQLAECYVSLAAGSSSAGRTHAYTRAEAYYKRFLEVHTAGDAQRLKAKLGLQKVRAQLAPPKKD